MKKLILTLLCFLVCQSAFAARVKYNIVTGEVISMAYTKDNKVGPNEALIDTNEDVVSDIRKYKVNPDGTFRKKTPQEITTDQEVRDREKADRKERKKAVVDKLGLDKQELNTLLEIIQDGSDD